MFIYMILVRMYSFTLHLQDMLVQVHTNVIIMVQNALYSHSKGRRAWSLGLDVDVIVWAVPARVAATLATLLMSQLSEYSVASVGILVRLLACLACALMGSDPRGIIAGWGCGARHEGSRNCSKARRAERHRNKGKNELDG